MRKSRHTRVKDPYQAREAQKYDNPIPSREFIIEVLSENGAPMGFFEVAERLGLSDEERQEALRRRLRAMERDGQLVCNRKQSYCLVNKRDLIAGRVIGHPEGFGFLKPDEGGDDLYLSFTEMRSLFHDDRAVVRVTGMDRRGRREGAVVEILERNTTSVVGRLSLEMGVGFVTPDCKRLSKDIIIPSSEIGTARHGQIVVVDILDQPTSRTPPLGRVVEVIGDHMAPGMETDIAVRAHGIRVAWPEEVETQVKTLPSAVTEQDLQGRVDLRKLPLVTIDGADARDFDDAVYCEPRSNGWRLLVSIADVSHYVKPGTPLDQEASARGNSVYFPDRVIPMLPEALSNGLCSINPRVDRLCMTCEMSIDQTGKVTRSRFYSAVMHSHARLTYDQVAAFLQGDEEQAKTLAHVAPHLNHLYQLFRVLSVARAERGAIDFDTTETRIVFNEKMRVQQILPVIRNDAHRLIEECMLLANVTAARYLLRKKIPALYRNHDGPKEEKLTDLRAFLGELGLSLPGGKKPVAGDYALLLERVQGRPDSHLIQTVLLRSLAQAVYGEENLGHFGLSFAAYTHFTSPIRRYPDLLVHRAIKQSLTSSGAVVSDYTKTQLQGLGEHCSNTERKADEATRDALDWLKCEYMLDKVGETYPGIITSVNSFGVFVELNDIYVDGLLHITALDNDYYHFDPVGHRLTGERTGKVIRLGDPIRVRVASVNLDEKKIDFVLADDGGQSRKSAAQSRSKRPPVADGEQAAAPRQSRRSRSRQRHG